MFIKQYQLIKTGRPILIYFISNSPLLHYFRARPSTNPQRFFLFSSKTKSFSCLQVCSQRKQDARFTSSVVGTCNTSYPCFGGWFLGIATFIYCPVFIVLGVSVDMEDYKVLSVGDLTYHIKYCFMIENTAFKTVRKTQVQR